MRNPPFLSPSLFFFGQLSVGSLVGMDQQRVMNGGRFKECGGGSKESDEWWEI